MESNHLTYLEDSLPSYWYYDEDFFKKEVANIWGNHWIYVCHKSRIKENRAFVTIKVANQNILVLRDSKGSLKAYFNTCRHRGSILCDQETGVVDSKLLRCPYHQWAYSVDTGGLISVASFSKNPEGFDKSKFSLFKVAVEEWRGFIFINLNENALWNPDEIFQRPPYAFNNFPVEDMVCGHVWEKIIDSNWKSFWENFNECLHCPNIHPELTDLVPMFSNRVINPKDLPTWIEKTKDSDPKYSGGLRSGAETWSNDGSAQDCQISTLTEEDFLKGHVYASSWPSMFLGGYADHVRAVRVTPVSSEKVKITAEWLFEKDTIKNKNYDINNVVSFACNVMEQDAYACELNQKGLHSIPYRNGVLMPEEYVIKSFHDWLRTEMGEKA